MSRSTRDWVPGASAPRALRPQQMTTSMGGLACLPLPQDHTAAMRALAPDPSPSPSTPTPSPAGTPSSTPLSPRACPSRPAPPLAG